MSHQTTPQTTIALAAVLIAIATASPAFAADDRTVSNPDGCKVVERKANNNDSSGTLSSSVTAGNGQVSAQTSGGNSVTVHSGNGSTSSSIATTGSGGRSTTVTTSDGNCTIYVNPADKKKE